MPTDAPTPLPPFPTGWYALASSRDVPPGAVRPITFAGREVVLFRTRGGAVCVMDAHCPHLGAHIGYGGTVQGESIRCPFHNFCFDVRGTCVSIPQGIRVPPQARARVWPTRETHGIVLAHFDGAGHPPAWEVPSLDTAGWSPPLSKAWSFRGHPQEATENSVDIAHFSQVHDYTDVEIVSDLVTDGPHLTVKYAMRRPTGFLGVSVRAEFAIHLHGLGYSLAEIEAPQVGLRWRLFVFATPVDGETINFRIALSQDQHGAARATNPLLAALPRALINPIALRATFRAIEHDVREDFVIWQHKRYVHPPVLSERDGPVGRYRQWAKQFYRAARSEVPA